MINMEFKEKTATEALEKIANAPLEHHWGCDQILIDGLHFSMNDVQDYAKATLNNQPKLSIPTKIAEQADKIDFDELFQRGEEEFYQWFDHEHYEYKEVIYAYHNKSVSCESWWVSFPALTLKAIGA